MLPPLPSLQEQARANAAIKERQILIDLAEDHPVKRQIYSNDEMLTLFQTALDTIKEKDDPDMKIRSLKLLKNGGILLEMLSKEAAEWLKPEARRNKFAAATGGKLNIKDRLFNIVVQFIPISTALEDDDTLRYIEEDSKIPRNSITSARWIKPISKRSPFQRFAHAIFSISSPVIANHIIKQGLTINRENLRAYKDKKEPLRCLKCQKWGHVARTCKADKDTCGSCAENHRSSACPSEKPPFCVNCNSADHSSSSRKCPEFLRKCQDLNARTPENSMPYFPTEEEWTQAPLPPKATGPIILARPPRPPNSNSTQSVKTTQQTTINRYYRPSQKQPTQSAVSTKTQPSASAHPESQSPDGGLQEEASPSPSDPSDPASPQEPPPSRFPSLSPLTTPHPLPPPPSFISPRQRSTDDTPSPPSPSL